MNVNRYGEYPPLRRSVQKEDVKPAPRTYSSLSAEAAEAPRADAVSISPMARHLARLRQTPEVRADVVEAMRAKLDGGELDSPEALASATGKMLAALVNGEL